MQESNPSAAKLKTLVPRCTVCSKDLSGHNFALIATTVAAEENRTRVEALFGHVRRHEWNALVGYGDFRPDENAALVYSITGPHEGGMVILIRDPSDLYEPADLYLQEQLSKEEIATVTALARAGDWQKL